MHNTEIMHTVCLYYISSILICETEIDICIKLTVQVDVQAEENYHDRLQPMYNTALHDRSTTGSAYFQPRYH